MSYAADDAKADWDARIAVRSDEEREFAFPDLDPPKEVTAVGGVGQVTIDWSPVDGAVGYLILRAHRRRTRSSRSIITAVTSCRSRRRRTSTPRAPRVRRTGMPSRACPRSPWPAAPSSTVGAVPLVADGTVPVVSLTVDTGAEGTELPRPWVPMVGSEDSVSCSAPTAAAAARSVVELEQALRRMHDEIGVRTVRAHAIFHDDTRVYIGSTAYRRTTSSVVDAIYDKLLGDRAAAGRRARLHAARTGQRPVQDGLRVRRDHLAPKSYEPGTTWSAPWYSTSSTGTASTRCSPGTSRSGTRPTWRCSGPAPRPSASTCTTRPRRQ